MFLGLSHYYDSPPNIHTQIATVWDLPEFIYFSNLVIYCSSNFPIAIKYKPAKLIHMNSLTDFNIFHWWPTILLSVCPA